MEFEREEYISFEKAEDFYDAFEWAIKEFNCKIDSYYIDEEEGVSMHDTMVTVGNMWIKPADTSGENYCNIVNMIKYIREYFEIELLIVDINVPEESETLSDMYDEDKDDDVE